MQLQFWNDIGPTSQDTETSTNSSKLLPTPNSPNRESNNADGCWGEWGGNGNWTSGQSPEESISSLAASPASLFRWLEARREWKILAGSGRLFAEFSNSSGQPTLLSRTCGGLLQRTMDGLFEEYSQTLPHSGSMRNGMLYQLQPLVLRISGTGSSLLPTARATDGTKGGPNQRGSKGDLTLPSAVQLLPTPTSRDHKSGKASQETWDRNNRRPLSETLGDLLNPAFVEAILGFPIGWTDLDASETPSSPK